MAFVSKQQRERRLVISSARVLIAMTVALSFLATVVPAGFSSAQQTMMDCCVGKPGHVPGSCATGLLGSAKKPQSASPVSSDPDPSSTSELSLAVVADVGAGEHCGLHPPAAGTPAPGVTVRLERALVRPA